MMRTGLAAILIVFSTTSCSELTKGIREKVEAKVKEETEPEGQPEGEECSNGEIPEEEGTTCDTPDSFGINSVSPISGSIEGNEPIEIIGCGFVEGTRIFFGNVEANPSQCEIVTANRVECLTPPSADKQFVDVIVVLDDDGNGTAEEFSVLENGFEYYLPVQLDSIAPVEILGSTPTVLTLTGQGFVDGSQVQIGDFDPLEPADINDEETIIQVVTGIYPAGLYPVRVSNINGEDTLPNALTVFDDVTIADIQPGVGGLGGGDTVRVQGTGFLDTTGATVGGNIATPSPASETEIDIVTPPAGAEGASDIVVTNNNGTAEVPGGFVYVDTANTNARIVHVRPAAALAAGGSTLRIFGVGLDQPDLSVQIASNAAPCTVVSDNYVECVTPAGSVGSTTLSVTSGAFGTLNEPFSYFDVSLASLVPAQGAQAGGTYIEMTGTGFDASTQIIIGGRSADNVTVNSATSLSFWTPFGDGPGSADVVIRTQGQDSTFADAFTFFDPSNTFTVTSGGPIEAVSPAVNITVIDGDGAPVLGAFTMLGSSVDVTRPYTTGVTDFRGQVTLSGPDVIGAQTVTTVKVGFGAFTIVEADAQNMLMQLLEYPQPPPEPLPVCPGGGGGAPPLVRGSISRLKDEFNTGGDTVVVTTSYPSRNLLQLPDPGPGGQLLNDGDFQIFTRTGELVVIAEVGLIGADQSFNPVTFGFKPFVSTEAGSGFICTNGCGCPGEEQCVPIPASDESFCTNVYDVGEILVDTPLRRAVPVSFENAPDELGLGDSANLFVYYDFDAGGIYPIASANAPSSTSEILLQMPQDMPGDLLGTPFVVETVFVPAFNLDPNLIQAASSNVASHTDTSLPIVVSPILDMLDEDGATFDTSPRVLNTTFKPDNSGNPLPTVSMHRLFDNVNYDVCISPLGPFPSTFTRMYWTVLTDGPDTDFDLPIFPFSAGGDIMGAAPFVGWQHTSYLVNDLDYNQLNLGALGAATARTTRLSVKFPAGGP